MPSCQDNIHAELLWMKMSLYFGLVVAQYIVVVVVESKWLRGMAIGMFVVVVGDCAEAEGCAAVSAECGW